MPLRARRISGCWVGAAIVATACARPAPAASDAQVPVSDPRAALAAIDAGLEGASATALAPLPKAVSRAVPLAPASPPRVAIEQVAIDGQSVCALASDGAVWCWGVNDLGREQAACGPHCDRPTRVPLPGPAVQVEVGVRGDCALLATHRRVCWGGNFNPSMREEANTRFVRLLRGDPTSCGIAEGGRILCKGDNYMGRLGFPNHRATESPMPKARWIPGLDHARDGFVGWSFGCAVLDGGGLRCWGNGTGCAGPVAMETGGRLVSVGGGGALWCFVRDDGTVGGLGEPWEMGHPVEPFCHGIDIDDAEKVLNPMPAAGATQVACYSNVGDTCASCSGCIVMRAGGVTCWNEPTPGDVPRKVDVPLAEAATSVVMGDGVSCAISVTHRLYCWGDNSMGAIGIGSASPERDHAPVEPAWP